MSDLENKKKPRCHNCKFAGEQFKIGKLTHLHCENKEMFTQKDFEDGKLNAWDSLRVFSNNCGNHQFKVKGN